jgi:hypothetical protein
VAVSFVALLPETQYMGSVVNNPVGALLAAAVVVSLSLRVLASPQPRRREWLFLGTAAAVALCTKLTALWTVPLIAAALGVHLRREGPLGRKLGGLGLLVAPVAVLLVPWLAHNELCYGTLVPERITDRRLFPDGLATALIVPERVADLLTIGTEDGLMGLGVPFWLFTPRVPVTGVAVATGLLFLTPLVGLGLAARRPREAEPTRERRARDAFWVGLAASLIAFWLLVLYMATRDWNVVLFGGRYLWEATGAIAFLWTLGLSGLPAGRVRWTVIAFLLAGLAVASVAVHGWVL